VLVFGRAFSIMGKNGSHAIGFKSALQEGQQYMARLQMVCDTKLSTIVLLVGLGRQFMFV
jgi:hypothetical protein